ncbi:MAG: tRNA (cytidine(34)-2'-O)-methyltransferase [Hyphomicrobiales bacterium]|nr:tRNA (cytidine(34)-2'-O)-methyltransferase [Hyphomicrobiales bacterium]
MRIALFEPDIPQNAATIIRMAACLDVAVDLIEPAGFLISDKTFRRAGLDYLDRASVARHSSFAACEDWRANAGRPRLVLLTTKGSIRHTDFTFAPDDIVMVGRESAGVPEAVHDRVDARVKIAMKSGLRSLNVAVSAAIVLGEALRQTGRYPAGG